MDQEKPIAFPVKFEGPAVYATPLEGTGYGVIFQDDGKTGFFFATDEGQGKVLDTLIVYHATDPDRLRKGEPAYVVYNPARQRAGLYYHAKFHAVYDFKDRTGCCRLGEPGAEGDWCTSGHAWNDEMTQGLEKQL